MQPIHELLARIRWDAELASSRFVIGCLDHVAHQVVHVDLREIAWDAENPSYFDLADAEGNPPQHSLQPLTRSLAQRCADLAEVSPKETGKETSADGRRKSVQFL